MDNLTHSLVGALIGQTGLKRKTGLAMPALIIGANLPDIDATCVLLGNMQHLALRRGITHGPIAWVLLPLVLAAILYGWDKWQTRRGKRPEARLPVRFGWLYALAFIGCLSHPALDWLNNYGIRLLEPFSDRWYYGDTLFIIDIWLWLGLGFATWLSLRREKKTGGNWRKPARVALVGAVAYIGANWLISDFSRDLAMMGEPYPSTAIPNPIPITFWERQVIVRDDKNRWISTGWTGPDAGYGYRLPSPAAQCEFPNADQLPSNRPDLDNFLFWSRAPFAMRAPDGSVVIHDARYYDPRISSGFSVALPELRCAER